MRYTPASELAQRIAGLQKLMQRDGIDGALIVQNADLFYFAGTVQRSHLFIPAEGKPVLMVKKSFQRAREESALEEVIPLANIKDLPVVLESYGYKNMRAIGLELDVLPAAHYLRYQKMFAPAEIVDTSGLIRTVRMIKSPYEIQILKDAAKLNHALFSRVKNFLKEGITEVELAGQLEAVYRRAGHQCHIRMRGFNQEMAYGHLMSGKNLAVPSYFDGPTGGPGLNVSFPQGAGYKKIGKNEPVMVDYVGVYDGYLVDQTRIFCIGRLPEKLTKAYEVAINVQEEIKSRAKPGVLCEDLYRCALNIAEASGMQEYFMGYPEPAPFVGHGVGIEVDELPVMARGFKIPLEKGMVIALEPKFVFPEGVVGIENTFVVGENGLENLTTFEEEIIYV